MAKAGVNIVIAGDFDPKAFKQAATEMNKLASAGDSSSAVFAKAGKALGTMAKAAAVAGLAAGAALVSLGVAAVNNADELQRQADVTGLTAERLQELEYAGKNLGVELDTIAGAQSKLTKAMAAAKDGTGTQADAFKALGIAVTDSNGNLRDSKDVMSEAFDKLSKVGNETERDALSMQLFGKSALEMNPMIKAGSDELNRLAAEARNNGAVMSNEAVAGLDAFGDTLENIKSGIMGAFGEKFAEMLPQIQGFIEKLKELPQWLDENKTKLEILGVIVGTITLLVIAYNIQQALATAGTTLWGAVSAAAAVGTTALGAAFAFLTSPIALVIIAIGLVVAAGILLYKNWDTIKEKASDLWDGIKAKFEGIKETVKNAVDAIKGFFSFEWKMPHIKMPHFKVEWSKEGFWGSVGEFLGLPGRPVIGVDWYANGGIFNNASVIGVGEAGPEAVIPLNNPRRANEIMQQAGIGGITVAPGAIQINASGGDPNAIAAAVEEALKRIVRNSYALGRA